MGYDDIMPNYYLVMDNDYIQLTNYYLEFNSANASIQVPVTIIDDNRVEPNEQLILHLELLQGKQEVYLRVNSVPLVIVDDDCELIYPIEFIDKHTLIFALLNFGYTV